MNRELCSVKGHRLRCMPLWGPRPYPEAPKGAYHAKATAFYTTSPDVKSHFMHPSDKPHTILLAKQTKGRKVIIPTLPKHANPAVTSDAYTIVRVMSEHASYFQIHKGLIRKETGLSSVRFNKAMKHLTEQNYVANVRVRKHGRLAGICYVYSPDGEVDKMTPTSVLHYSVDVDGQGTRDQRAKRAKMRRELALGSELTYEDTDTHSASAIITGSTLTAPSEPAHLHPYNEELQEKEKENPPNPLDDQGEFQFSFFSKPLVVAASALPLCSVAEEVVQDSTSTLSPAAEQEVSVSQETANESKSRKLLEAALVLGREKREALEAAAKAAPSVFDLSTRSAHGPQGVEWLKTTAIGAVLQDCMTEPVTALHSGPIIRHIRRAHLTEAAIGMLWLQRNGYFLPPVNNEDMAGRFHNRVSTLPAPEGRESLRSEAVRNLNYTIHSERELESDADWNNPADECSFDYWLGNVYAPLEALENDKFGQEQAVSSLEYSDLDAVRMCLVTTTRNKPQLAKAFIFMPSKRELVENKELRLCVRFTFDEFMSHGADCMPALGFASIEAFEEEVATYLFKLNAALNLASADGEMKTRIEALKQQHKPELG